MEILSWREVELLDVELERWWEVELLINDTYRISVKIPIEVNPNDFLTWLIERETEVWTKVKHVYSLRLFTPARFFDLVETVSALKEKLKV